MSDQDARQCQTEAFESGYSSDWDFIVPLSCSILNVIRGRTNKENLFPLPGQKSNAPDVNRPILRLQFATDVWASGYRILVPVP